MKFSLIKPVSLLIGVKLFIFSIGIAFGLFIQAYTPPIIPIASPTISNAMAIPATAPRKTQKKGPINNKQL